MKLPILIGGILLLSACNPQNENTQKLQNQNAYKPGFGEFMSSIQVHHNKLWFAGQNPKL